MISAEQMEPGQRCYRPGGTPGYYYERPRTADRIERRIRKRARQNLVSGQEDWLLGRLGLGWILLRRVWARTKEGTYLAAPPEYKFRETKPRQFRETKPRLNVSDTGIDGATLAARAIAAIARGSR